MGRLPKYLHDPHDPHGPPRIPRAAWRWPRRAPYGTVQRAALIGDHLPRRHVVQGAKCMTRKPLAQSRNAHRPSACLSGRSSPTNQARRRSKSRMGPDATRPRCIAYFVPTGARCRRLASRRGWRAPLFLCAAHGRGFAALQAMVAGYSACRRVALADWRFAREIAQ
jgi:hypothetical protein